MTYTNAVAAAFIAENGVIDKLEDETSIPKSDRDFLAALQTKLGSTSSRPSEDERLCKILTDWMLRRHRITA